MKRFWTGVFLSVFLMGAAGAAPARTAAPNFKLNDLNGKAIQLSALRGKVVLLDFWATWCPPCRAEIPYFIGFYKTYKGKGLEIIGLSVGEKPETVKQFVQSNGINYPIAITSGQIEQAYGGIRGIPTTFLIDKQGRIANKLIGYHDKEVFEKEIQALLAE